MTNFPVCICPKDDKLYCKNWDGTGNQSKRVAEIRMCEFDPAECGFSTAGRKREGCEWVWETIAGSPIVSSPVAPSLSPAPAPKKNTEAPDKEPKVKTVTLPALTCADCGEKATHRIEGYKPTLLCEEHAKRAEQFHPVRIEEE